MDDMEAQGMQPGMGAENEQDDAGVTEVCLKIKDTGEMTVCLEVAGEDKQETPARSLEDAMRLVKQIASGVLSGTSSPGAAVEQAAFEKEMAA